MIKLSKELVEKIEKRIQNTDFTVESYVNYIIKQVLDNIKQSESKENSNSQESDQNKVKERLKRLESLGYLD